MLRGQMMMLVSSTPHTAKFSHGMKQQRMVPIQMEIESKKTGWGKREGYKSTGGVPEKKA